MPELVLFKSKKRDSPTGHHATLKSVFTQLFPSPVTGVQSSDNTSDIFLQIKLLNQRQIRNQQQDSHTDLRNSKTQSAQWESEQRNGVHILLCAKRIRSYPRNKVTKLMAPTNTEQVIYLSINCSQHRQQKC